MLTFVQRPHLRWGGLDVTLGVVESWAAVDMSAFHLHAPTALCPMRSLGTTAKAGLQLLSLPLLLGLAPAVGLVTVGVRVWLQRVRGDEPAEWHTTRALNCVQCLVDSALLGCTSLLASLVRLLYCVHGVPGTGPSPRLLADGNTVCAPGYSAGLAVVLAAVLVPVLWDLPRRALAFWGSGAGQVGEVPLGRVDTGSWVWEEVQLAHRVALCLVLALADTRTPAARAAVSVLVCVLALVVHVGWEGMYAHAAPWVRRLQTCLLFCLGAVAVINGLRAQADVDQGAYVCGGYVVCGLWFVVCVCGC
jgi:hypothetical protein